jgi:hypothetical protein
MKVILVISIILLVAGVVIWLVHLPAVGIPSLVIGVIGILVYIFRRWGRPGDFERSGWTGS